MSKHDEFANMPISRVVYGEDHPKHRLPVVGKEPFYPGTRIAGLLSERTLKRIARKFPRTRKYLPRKEKA